MQQGLHWHLPWHSVSAALVELQHRLLAIQLGMQARNTTADRLPATTGSTTSQTGGHRATTLRPTMAQPVAASLGHRKARVEAAPLLVAALVLLPAVVLAVVLVPDASLLGVQALRTQAGRRQATTGLTIRQRIGRKAITHPLAMAQPEVVSRGHPMEAVPVAAVALVLAVDRRLLPAFLLPARLGTSMLPTSI